MITHCRFKRRVSHPPRVRMPGNRRKWPAHKQLRRYRSMIACLTANRVRAQAEQHELLRWDGLP